MDDDEDRIPEPDEDLDALAILRAGLDQAAALAPEIARVCRANYDAFLAVGFSDTQALYFSAVQLVQNPAKFP